MDALIAYLNSLGPWGVVAGVVLTLAIQYLRNRYLPAPPANPNAPVPSPTPVPLPLPAPSNTPVLDALLQMLRDRLSRNVAGEVADITSDTAADVLNKCPKCSQK